MTRALAFACLAFFCACTDTHDERTAGDYERIVTLAPNLTELAFAVGAGDSIVGVKVVNPQLREPVPVARVRSLVGSTFGIQGGTTRTSDTAGAPRDGGTSSSAVATCQAAPLCSRVK